MLKSGGSFVPLDAHYPSERQSFILRNAGVRLIITEQRLADRHAEHCETLAAGLRQVGLRCSVDTSRERMQKKVRAAQLMKVPYTIVAGDRDVEAGTVAVRDRHGNEVRGIAPDGFATAAARIAEERSLAAVDLQALAG